MLNVGSLLFAERGAKVSNGKELRAETLIPAFDSCRYFEIDESLRIVRLILVFQTSHRHLSRGDPVVTW